VPDYRPGELLTVEQRLSIRIARAVDVIVTMGCGDACPIFPGKRYEDWVIDDPSGQPLHAVRAIRDDLRARVLELVASLELATA
jgi:arsenate reductase